MPIDLSSFVEFIGSSDLLSTQYISKLIYPTFIGSIDFYQILSGKIPHPITFIENPNLSIFCISNKTSIISLNESTNLIPYPFVSKLSYLTFIESDDFYYHTPGIISHYNIIFTENANFIVNTPILLKGKVYYATGLREYCPRIF